MIIRRAELDAIRAGEVDLAVRRWDRARLRVGTRMRTAVGVIEVTAVDEVRAVAVTDSEARRAGAASRADLFDRLVTRAGRSTFRVALRFAGPDPRIALRETADLDDDELAALSDRLARLDRGPRGPWTRAVLALIEASPATRAADLAAGLGRDTPSFKRDVRKLKELGLTESLEVGYRLSPRGETLVRSSSAPIEVSAAPSVGRPHSQANDPRRSES